MDLDAAVAHIYETEMLVCWFGLADDLYAADGEDSAVSVDWMLLQKPQQ